MARRVSRSKIIERPAAPLSRVIVCAVCLQGHPPFVTINWYGRKLYVHAGCKGRVSDYLIMLNEAKLAKRAEALKAGQS